MKKFSRNEMVAMQAMLENGYYTYQVAERFGCSVTTLNNLRNRKEVKSATRSYSKAGGLTVEKMKEVIELKSVGFKVAEIATYFEVSIPTIYNWLGKAKGAYY